jgi:hypothetical protein
MSKILLRVVCHLVAELPLLVVAGLQIGHGWVPTSDDAVIAWRTWGVFSSPVPLTGQFSQVTAIGGHPAFDLGPLQYFLLAVPERIDPVHGVLWGAALLAAGLAALCIEAVWSSCGPGGGVLVAVGLAITAETLVQSTVNLAWNPSTGVYALVATMGAAVAVAERRYWWLPVSIASGSLAAQCHLSFAAPVAAAVVAGSLVGAARRRGLPLGVVAVSIVVGVGCWVAPLVQELTGHPGNWSVVADSLSRHGPSVGFAMGLRGVAAATHLPPSWWIHLPSLGTVTGFGVFTKHLYDGSVAWGAAALALCAAIGMAAAVRRRQTLASVAAVTTATALAAAWTLGSVPVSQAHYLHYYLYFVLWPVGMAVLAVIGVGVLSVLVELWRMLARPAEDATKSLKGLRTGALAVALAAAGSVLLVLDIPMGSSSLFLMGWSPVQLATRTVVIALPVLERHDSAHGATQPFDLVASENFSIYQANVTDAVAYLLAAKGYPVRVSGAADQPLGPRYLASPNSPVLFVHLGAAGVITVRWEPQIGSKSPREDRFEHAGMQPLSSRSIPETRPKRWQSSS